MRDGLSRALQANVIVKGFLEKKKKKDSIRFVSSLLIWLINSGSHHGTQELGSEISLPKVETTKT